MKELFSVPELLTLDGRSIVGARAPIGSLLEEYPNGCGSGCDAGCYSGAGQCSGDSCAAEQ